jgi:hypothetical protein
MRTRLHRQARKNTCMVAAVRTVLDVQLGIKVAEVAIEAHATTAQDPIQKYGSCTAHLRAMVRGVSRTHNLTGKTWRVRVRRVGDLDALARELAAGRIPIVQFFIPGSTSNYHAIVVLGVTEDKVKIFDPWPSGPIREEWLSYFEFLYNWGLDGKTRWYAVVNAD